MALTRKFLKDLGIESEEVEKIIKEHLSSVDGLKDEIDNLKSEAENHKAVEKELNQLKEQQKSGDSYKDKYETLKKEYEGYKADIVSKETAAAKTKAVKEYFESKNIKGNNLDIALRGCKEEISSIELKDGKIADTKILDELITNTYAGLVAKTTTQGANVANPPGNNGGKTTRTKAEIMAIKDVSERQKAIAENPEAFGLSTN